MRLTFHSGQHTLTHTLWTEEASGQHKDSAGNAMHTQQQAKHDNATKRGRDKSADSDTKEERGMEENFKIKAKL